MTIASLDLNLLVTLRALLELRNVTRASERLHQSQPATSTALARLRRHFDDELLVRVGREYELTPVAQSLLPYVIDAVVAVERAFTTRPVFAADVSDRRFIVAISDFAAAVLEPRLSSIMSVEAPGVTLHLAPMPVSLTSEQLIQYDAVVAPVGYGIDTLHEPLFQDEFVCVTGREDAESLDVLDLLRTAPHAALRLGEGVATHAERICEDLGVDRRVAVSISSMVSLPLLVRGTELVAVVPRRLAELVEPIGGLRVLPLPLDSGTHLSEALYWQRARNGDPAVQWLRSLFRRGAEALPG